MAPFCVLICMLLYIYVLYIHVFMKPIKIIISSIVGQCQILMNIDIKVISISFMKHDYVNIS